MLWCTMVGGKGWFGLEVGVEKSRLRVGPGIHQIPLIWKMSDVDDERCGT